MLKTCLETIEAANQAIFACSIELEISADIVTNREQALKTCKELNEARTKQVIALAEENATLRDAPSSLLLTILGFVVGLAIGIPITL